MFCFSDRQDWPDQFVFSGATGVGSPIIMFLGVKANMFGEEFIKLAIPMGIRF